MNLGRNGTRRRLDRLQAAGPRLGQASLLTILKIGLFGIIVCGVMGVMGSVGIVKGILSNSPDISTLDVSPQGISTTVYDTEGNLIETLVTTGSNRDPVSYEKIPGDLVNAFVAIEDSRFWLHKGVDLRGMARAAVLGAKSGFRRTQGASTITQQLIKNNVFEGGAENTLGAKVVRKIQEQYLAMELEKSMSKEEIIRNYLNTINLGSNCLGVQTAAKRYFDKDVSELTLSECAVIAGITQNPVGYNPITHPDKNSEKRATILEYMKNQGYITEAAMNEALADPVYDRIQAVNARYQSVDSEPYSYFVDRMITEVLTDLRNKCGYSEAQAQNLLYSGGLKIYTTQDPQLQAIVDEEISDPDNYSGIENFYSFTYSLILRRDGQTVSYSESDIRKQLDRRTLDYKSKDTIREVVANFKKTVLQEGDEILADTINYTLQPQTSIVLMDQSTGYVSAISGGRGEKTVSLSLNRATGTRRSPGSTFKVLTAFAPAIDACHATLGTTYYDEPYTDITSGKSFRNWWGSSTYAGYANIRQAITYSMNIVAVRCLTETVTPELGYDYALSFGFNTLYESKEINGQIFTDINPSLALGGLTDGVTNLQLTGAYASLANGGIYTKPVFYTKILDHDGNVLIDNTPERHRVVSEATAFLMTDAMQDSTEPHNMNGLFNSTSTTVNMGDMAVAGKSGTTTGKTDLWFVGYTPYYTMGIWTGFDDNTPMEGNEGSSSYHKQMWKKIMTRVDKAKQLKDTSFSVPGDLVKETICAKSGKLATKTCSSDRRGGDSMVYKEYFTRDTVPTDYCDIHMSYTACSETGRKATAYCPETYTRSYIVLPRETTGDTQDSDYAGRAYYFCQEHTLEKFLQAQEESRKAEEESKKAEAESRKAAEESKKAAEASKKAAEASKKAAEASKKAAEKDKKNKQPTRRSTAMMEGQVSRER